MKKSLYTFWIFIFLTIIGTGIFFAIDYHHDVIYPLESSTSSLDRVLGSENHATIHPLLQKVKSSLPSSGNPVWIYPTESTNFERIQTDLDIMIASSEDLKMIPSDTSAYHSEMLMIHAKSNYLRENLSDVIPFMYGSISFAFFISLFLVGSMGMANLLLGKFE